MALVNIYLGKKLGTVAQVITIQIHEPLLIHSQTYRELSGQVLLIIV